MLTDNPSSLADRLCGAGEGATFSGINTALRQAIISLLALGQPVSLSQAATSVGWSHEEVLQTIKKMNIEFDEGGNIVGAGLTLRPTPHRIKVDGHLLYTWCALDALMYMPLLGRPVQVESPCAKTGDLIRMTVTPQRVKSYEPAEAVVSLIYPKKGLPIRQAFCNHVNFFRSPEAAASWLAQQKEATILSIDDAYAFGQQLLSKCC